jgi:hypothetical protein
MQTALPGSYETTETLGLYHVRTHLRNDRCLAPLKLYKDIDARTFFYENRKKSTLLWLFTEFFLEVNNHFCKDIFENLMTVLLD